MSESNAMRKLAVDKATRELRRAKARFAEACCDLEEARKTVVSAHNVRGDMLSGKHTNQDESGYPKVIGVLAVTQFEDGSYETQRNGLMFSDFEIALLTSLSRACSANMATGLHMNLYGVNSNTGVDGPGDKK